METALIEAAAPTSLMFDPEKSRLILDPLISRDPNIKLTPGDGAESNRDQMLWGSVSRTAQRQAEAGQPAAAMEWLARLPFSSENDYAKAAANVLKVWNLKSETEASAWLRNTSLNPAVRTELAKAVQ
jgi:hypothetical protein